MSNLRLTTQSLRLRFTQTQAAGVLLFLYLCHPFFVSALRAVMGPFRLASLARPAASILIYGALLLFCAAGRRFKASAEYIMRNAGLKEAQAGIKTAKGNINKLIYADNTTLMAESEGELKSFLMKVNEKSEKVG